MPVEFHIFVFAFTIAYPIAGFLSYRKLLRSIESGNEIDRLKVYRGTIINQWLLFVVGVLLYRSTGRPWSDIGVRWPEISSLLVSIILLLVALVILYRQIGKLRATPDEDIHRYSDHLGNIASIVPTKPSELRKFNWLAVTAGIVEEFLWRGLLIWYLNQFVAILPAAVLATIAFGLAHAYQGLTKMLQIILVAVFLTGLYLYTESLLLVVVLHTATDLLQGRLAYEIVTRVPALVELRVDRIKRT